MATARPLPPPPAHRELCSRSASSGRRRKARPNSRARRRSCAIGEMRVRHLVGLARQQDRNQPLFHATTSLQPSVQPPLPARDLPSVSSRVSRDQAFLSVG